MLVYDLAFSLTPGARLSFTLYLNLYSASITDPNHTRPHLKAAPNPAPVQSRPGPAPQQHEPPATQPPAPVGRVPRAEAASEAPPPGTRATNSAKGRSWAGTGWDNSFGGTSPGGIGVAKISAGVGVADMSKSVDVGGVGRGSKRADAAGIVLPAPRPAGPNMGWRQLQVSVDGAPGEHRCLKRPLVGLRWHR